jgi:hypothetical protein
MRKIFVPITVVKGTVNTEIVTKEIPKVFICISDVEIVIMYDNV